MRLGRHILASGLLTGGLLACLSVFGPHCAEAADDPATAETTQSLVFLRSEHPVFVRLIVLLDGQELRVARNERLRVTFAELDSNSDGVIDQVERDGHPQALRKLGVREKWPELVKVIDTQPQDEKITLVELTEYGLKLFGPPVMLAQRTRSVRRNSQAVELFDLLDENQDQRLSAAEFAGLGNRLRKLDADGDDAFSVIEVEPFRNPFGPRVRNPMAQPEDSPWVMAEMAAEAVLKRFDQQAPKGSLNAAELGLPETVLATGDRNHDGALTLDELSGWLPTVPPHYTAIVTLPQRKPGLPNVTWSDAAAPTPPPGPKQRVRATKNLETLMAGQPLQLQVNASRASQSDNLNFYKLQFRRSDADKNKYLSQAEFGSMNLPGATFEIVDADGNGEVHENEISDFLNLENLVDQGHVMLTYDSNEVSLFSILDLDRDNRLSPRECLKVSDSWQSFDHNHDGQLERHELSGKLRLTVELVKPRLFSDAAMAANNLTGEPVINEKTAGPVWFRGMDRNKDGDVSRREFPGTEAAFQKWDKDGDGLISSAEAE